MSKLMESLKKLGEDAILLNAYKRDPESVLRRQGLNDEEIGAVMTADIDKLNRLGGHADYQMFVLIHHGSGRKERTL
ncbi:hypothetical protein [Shewanella sedimentimangrovi]|uniref:Extradiol ring-cleavage dioxygenase LigAB LigA subunit domain-containing protein n=1 Tax=Shewanella sedimentimangrovi TaxID=2814293 RepID=A0ABX7QXC4_9GAMM|nr:hypothetical protein [Shewanella sedimentimangrovi]QSX36167.1 hypothetical protein JYB85_12575 [Shewanella sedimentimangrovi]